MTSLQMRPNISIEQYEDTWAMMKSMTRGGAGFYH